MAEIAGTAFMAKRFGAKKEDFANLREKVASVWPMTDEMIREAARKFRESSKNKQLTTNIPKVRPPRKPKQSTKSNANNRPNNRSPR